MKKMALRLGLYLAFTLYLLADIYGFHGPMYHLMKLGDDKVREEERNQEVYVAKVYGKWISKSEIDLEMQAEESSEVLDSPVLYRIFFIRRLNRRVDYELLCFNAKYHRREVEEELGREGLNREELNQFFLQKQYRERGAAFNNFDDFKEEIRLLFRAQAKDKLEFYEID